jgi:hypothetical protein
MLTLKTKWIVREKKEKYLSEENRSHNEITTTDERSIGKSEFLNFFLENT